MADSGQYSKISAVSVLTLRRLRQLPNDSPAKAVIMTLLVCLVASLVVAGSAVILRPIQIANRQLVQNSQIIEILMGATADGTGPAAFNPQDLHSRVVDLASGDYVAAIDPATFDARVARDDPARSVAVPADKDLAQIRRRANFAVVHLAIRDGKVQAVILPVHGLGYASTLFGYIGLSADTERVIGLRFYDHAETPGLGAMIDDPAWQSLWVGKTVWAPGGEVGLGVARGPVVAGTPEAVSHVDGITGATWTGQGVTNLLRYWLGDHGFGPYLKKLRSSAR